ncbi:restriction endonuclease subunit S [Trueperella pyogenes]|uniref:restriction endonuclease subunit S n=1 Tax=Trueperella pyogenes TaxID=1661 RepID=UPI0006B23B66|nr:restriction endonuclease subunit S [Trueperella pyogenes]ALD73322.1 hypothetical protein AN946_01980 [Trueperella pyogenes]MDF2419355.1 restriction endonuclease subunit S [Trueperella pyogenes]
MKYVKSKISEIGRVVTGKTPSTAKEEFYDGEYMFVTPSELHGEAIVKVSEKTVTDAGLEAVKSNVIDGKSVLVGCIGWDMGNVAMTEDRCVTNQQINTITRFKQCAIPEYVYYWLRTKKSYLKTIASVTRTPILSKSVFEEIEIPLPPRDIQIAISHLLSSLDSKIANNNRITESLQSTLALLYGYWFLQFDFPGSAGEPYRSSGGHVVWNDALKREIPAGWTAASIIDSPFCQLIKPGVDQFTQKRYLATADVIGTSIGDGNLVEYETRGGRANMQPAINSVWFARMKGSVKHLFLSEDAASIIEETILSTGFCGLACEEYAFEYMASLVSSPHFETTKNYFSNGATQQAVSNIDLQNIMIVIPDRETLAKYSRATKPILQKMSSNVVENRYLRELRDWLLPMLINGQASPN